jgi:hypothetical protein
MTDISVRTIKTYGNTDQRWIGPGGQRALRDNDTITLDRSGFDLVTNFPNGFIPSGIVLGKITSSGLYVPYAGRSAEVQTITVDATGGNFTLKLDGETTANISATATAAAVKAALETLSNVSPGDVTVTGGPGGAGGATPYSVTFGGRWLGLDVPTLVATGVSLTGGASTVVVATGTGGGSTASDGSEIAVGFLAVPVAYDRNSASTADLPAPLYWHGEVVESFLPAHHGLDAAAKADLAAKFRFV